jgi:hypothetical protein
MKISCAHASLQHTDGWIQQWRDARTLFRRAKARGHLWVTGTERNRHLAGQARKTERSAGRDERYGGLPVLCEHDYSLGKDVAQRIDIRIDVGHG